MRVAAAYYDGRSARCHEVVLSVEGDRLRLVGADETREEPIAAVQIPAPLGRAPRLILFADGARCEVADHAGFAALMQAHTPSLVARLEARWSAAVLALLVSLGLIAA